MREPAGVIVAALLTAVPSLVVGSAAQARTPAAGSLTFRVTSIADTHDAHPGDGRRCRP